MTTLAGPLQDPTPAVLRSIAKSIEPAFPTAAETLRGIAAALSDPERPYCLRCEVPIYQDEHGVWRREATGIADCPRNPAKDGHEPHPALPDPEQGEWTHCRWSDPHPPVVRPGSYVPHVRATGKSGAECATCGEALTSVIPPGPEQAVREALDKVAEALEAQRQQQSKAHNVDGAVCLGYAVDLVREARP